MKNVFGATLASVKKYKTQDSSPTDNVTIIVKIGMLSIAQNLKQVSLARKDVSVVDKIKKNYKINCCCILITLDDFISSNSRQ
ncbi:CLUMA_CG013658, isoform A [Clunio marinus]|uniref:CLUMA_CG013658, isoform A n=1 Tax=Clunio marinus TaxID=568069 RepID=A0A1J1IJG9_9DIPT|nr:CLUMA_CG013658, isoform A [Clunio marinus]